MFSAPHEYLLNILHESTFHCQCHFFAVTFTFVFITELYGIKKKSELANQGTLTYAANKLEKTLHVFECLIFYSARDEKKN